MECDVFVDSSGPHVVSLGGGVYCSSMSEMVELSVSTYQAAAGCSVPLKEGMRPVVAAETEVAETGKDEKRAEKAAETAATGEGKVSEEQTVYVLKLFLLM